MDKMNQLEKPLNANERYLHGINIRLDALIHMMSSFLEVYANQNEITTTTNKVEEVKADVLEEIQTQDKPKRKRKHIE